MAASTPTFVSSTPTASPDLLPHAHCHHCATEQATGAARATRMPAQLAGTWLKSHRSAPCTPQPAALTWGGRTAKIPAAKAVLGLPSASLLRRARRDVFCVSQPNFPRCLASSQARLLPPAFVFLPGARREGITAGREGTHWCWTKQHVPPAAPRRSPQRHLRSSASWSWASSKRAHAYSTGVHSAEGAQRKDQGKGLLFFPSDSAACPRAQAVRPQRPCQGEESRRAETAGLFCPTPLQSDFS